MKVDAAASPLVRAKVRHSEGVLARHQGDYAEASKLFADSLALFREAGDKNGVAEALNNLGILATNRAEYAAALELFDESLSLFRKLDDRRGTAMLLNNVAHIALIRGDYERAGRLLEESLQLHKASGEQIDPAWQSFLQYYLKEHPIEFHGYGR
jgi:tetratricopeptide (TPR) repeat protein